MVQQNIQVDHIHTIIIIPPKYSVSEVIGRLKGQSAGKLRKKITWLEKDPPIARRTWLRMNKWQSVMRKEVRFVMHLDCFRKLGLVFLHDFTQTNLQPQR